MRIGSLAGLRTRFGAGLLVAAALLAMPVASFGQVHFAHYDASGPTAYEAQQAYYSAPAGCPSPYVDAYGNAMVIPAGYCESCGQGCDHGCGGNGCYGGGCCASDYPGCCPMGCGGTDPPVGYDLMNDAGIEGDLVDQRGPNYWDVRVETVFLRRDKGFEQHTDFSSQNVSTNRIVLSSDQLNGENSARLAQIQALGVNATESSTFDNPNFGFRIMGRYDICPLSVIEIGYTGIFDMNAKATVTDPSNNLYSLFSRNPTTGLFGTDPPTVSLAPPQNPNPETEQAHFQSISLVSDLQTAEISYRRYWLGYIPRVSGTLLAGFRYTRLDDNFNFNSEGSQPIPNTITPLAGLEYKEECENNLAGFQTGGDVWVSLMQGLRFGSEGKVGIYDNHSTLTNRIVTTPVGIEPPTLFEQFKDDNPAFLCDASLDLVADIFPSFSFRAGYEVMFMNQLVLAGRNFNPTSPYLNGTQGPRIPFEDHDGQLFFYGGHVGFEYTW